MWDTVVETGWQLSRDAPCRECGHAMHTFLPCSDTCDCAPPVGGGRTAPRVFTAG